MYRQNKFPTSSLRVVEQMRSLAVTNDGSKVHSRRRSKDYPFWPHLFMALFGVGWAVSFDFGARFYGAEFVSLLGFLLLSWRTTLLQYLNLKKITLIYVLWVGAIALSDLINQSSLLDWGKASATPVLGGVSLIVCCHALATNPRALLTFFCSIAAGKALLGDASYGDAFRDYDLSFEVIQANTNIFKVRIEPVLTPLAMLIACLSQKNSLKIPIFLFIITGIFYFLMDARSGGLILLLAATLLAKIQFGIKLRQRIFLVGLASVLVTSFGYVGYVGYVKYTLTYNSTGHSGAQLQYLDNPYNPLALLAQARPEWSVMPLAISERPLFGWGSWAEDDNFRFSSLQAERTSGDNYALIETQQNKNPIPFHSLVGSVWLWSGILGFGLMIWLMKIIWNMGQVLTVISSPLIAAASVMIVTLLWHYFFSPPMIVRLGFPIALATLIVLTDRTQKPLANITNQRVTRF